MKHRAGSIPLVAFAVLVFALTGFGKAPIPQAAPPAQRSATAGPQGDTVTKGSVHLEPCQIGVKKENALCAYYQVFEDRQTRKGRKIGLKLVILPATGTHPVADPIFFLAGGPGQSIIDVAPAAYANLISELRSQRDLVLLDQRGTGGSNALWGSFYPEKDDMRTYFNDQFSAETLRKSRAELEKIADLTLYTSSVAADDLDEVRAALGYKQINLYGGSYGTTLALVYLRRHPRSVRSMVLTGIAPPSYRNPLFLAQSVDHSLNRVFEDCSADKPCTEAFPHLRGEFEEILAALDKQAAGAEVANPVNNKMQSVSINRSRFLDQLRLLLYEQQLSQFVPLAIHFAHGGDWSPFVRLSFLAGKNLAVQIPRGLYFSVVCSEDVPFITEEDIRKETAGTFIGDSKVREFIAACKEWPKARVAPAFIGPVKSGVPVLLFSGDLDPVTPPKFGEEVVRNLPNGKHVIFRNAAHTTGSDCADKLTSEFIAAGSPAGLDSSCADEVKRPPFVTPAMLAAQAQGSASASSTAGESRGDLASIEGEWHGALEAGGRPLRLRLKVTRESDARFSSVIVSVDQQNAVFPINTIVIEKDKLHFEIKVIGAAYDGSVDFGSGEISGNWIQANRAFPLTFKRAGK